MSKKVTKHEYTIGGEKYIQEKLTLGQIRQLNDMLGEISLTDISPEGILRIFAERSADFVGILLYKEGSKLRDKNLDETIEELAFTMDYEQGLDVIADFFDCNPMGSAFKKFKGELSGKLEMLKKTADSTETR